MATQGVGTYKLNSFWESGRLIYYEKAYGHTTTGDVFILGHDYVQVGDTANDVDFQWYGTTTGTFVLDAAAHTLAMTGMAASIDGIFTISNATEATSTTAGALVVTGGIAFAKDMYVGDDVFLTSAAKLDWAAGNALLTHSTGLLTFSASNVAFGVDATGIDVTFFGDTAAYKAWFDQNGDTNGAWYFGADDYGIDVGFYGVTASNSMTWDASANALVFVAGGITLGVATNIVLDTTTGTKIGTAANQKLAFFNATPVIQEAHITDASVAHALNATFSDTEAEAALNALGTIINSILADLAVYGLQAAT